MQHGQSYGLPAAPRSERPIVVVLRALRTTAIVMDARAVVATMTLGGCASVKWRGNGRPQGESEMDRMTSTL